MLSSIGLGLRCGSEVRGDEREVVFDFAFTIGVTVRRGVKKNIKSLI